MESPGPERQVEREAKLVAPREFRLPDLDGVVKGAAATPLPVVHLDAVYYDTTDLRLARSGSTLRYRSGEPGAPWTVKLPARGNGSYLSREELTFSGPPDQIPAAAAELVVATTRAERLGPVARITTVRQPVAIRGTDGQLLAEVVDDTVTVSQDERPTARFREVEVELHGNPSAGHRLLRAVISRLEAAGAVVDIPMPKLVRALGARASQPPEIVVTPVVSDASIRELMQHAIARSAAQILHHDPGVRLGGDPEDIHQLRVATRRLRSDLRTFSDVLDGEIVGAIREELRWLGGLVGAVRDTDVLADRLTSDGATLDVVDAPARELILRGLDNQAVEARAVMIDAMRSPRYVHLLDTLVELAAAAPVLDTGNDRPPAAWCAKIVRRQWRHLRNAVHELEPVPSNGELHQVRIRAKRCRYASEAVTPIVGKAASRFADAMADVQTLLGDHQDTVVTEAWLREAAVRSPDAGIVAGQLIALERAQRAELRRQWPHAWKVASAQKLRWWR